MTPPKPSLPSSTRSTNSFFKACATSSSNPSGEAQPTPPALSPRTCALALVQCRGLNSVHLLTLLTELFADKELPVRVNAARAVEQVGSDAAMLMLRLRAELGSSEPELLGACYSGVLHLEGPSAIPWAAKFLPPGDDAAAEAAIAIAETRTPESFAILKESFERARDPWFRTALLSAVALTRQEDAFNWLLTLIEREDRNSKDAHEALCRSGPPNAILDRLQQIGKPCAEIDPQHASPRPSDCHLQ